MWASETFKYNHPEAHVITNDIRKVTDEEILNKFSGRVDVLLGGPPCQGFSIANKKAGDAKDPRNSLFVEFLRVARLLMPEVVIMENVPNLIKARTKSGEFVLNIIKQELKELGYFVEHTIISATDYGVPQIRKRLLVVASKKQLVSFFPPPTHSVNEDNSLFPMMLKPCPTLWDAISDLPEVEACGGAEEMDYTREPENDYQRLLRKGATKLYNHKAMNHTHRMVERFKAIKWGESGSDVPDELKPYKRNSKELATKVYSQNSRRMYPFKPCHTIAASFYANFVHPYKNRNFTAREGARIQSFPDYYVFKGHPTTPSHSLLKKEGRLDEIHLCQYNQIGNAVPPLMAEAIAENIYRQLNQD